MIENSFLRQEATMEIISNVTSFCSKCYDEILQNEIIFYDMKNYCYLCAECQDVAQKGFKINCEALYSYGDSLFL